MLTTRKLVGMRRTTTIANNQTGLLWQSFMPRRRDISNPVSAQLFSVQVYPATFDFSFADVNHPFEKWAAVEVFGFAHLPDGMETLVLPGGLYAVFDYKGLSTDTAIFQYLFGEWLPQSATYRLDSRPHFEILGDRYRNNDPASEEEIWIPVRLTEQR